MAGAWTSMWGSHMLLECDHLTNLTRYHSLPHLNLESRISSTSYSSLPLTAIGPGYRGCGCSTISSGIYGQMLETETTGWTCFSCVESQSLMAAGEMTLVMRKGPAHLWSNFFIGWSDE